MPGVLPEAVSRAISSIPMSYRSVELSLQKLTEDVYDADDFDMNVVNVAYTQSIEVLRAMEEEWQSLLALIYPVRAGSVMNNIGGYRKRKQRTQCKQYKQKHRKTLKRK